MLIAGRGWQPMPALHVAAYVVGAAAVLSVPLAILAGDMAGLLVPFNSPQAWVWILAGGITGAAIPTTAFISGIGIIGPSRAAIVMTLEPLVGVTIAALLLGEQPSIIQLLGGAAVLVAAAVLQVAPRTKITARARVRPARLSPCRPGARASRAILADDQPGRDRAAPLPCRDRLEVHRARPKSSLSGRRLGTRFLPATKAQPKEMLPLVDKPVIQYGIEEAVAAGIEHVIIVTSRLKQRSRTTSTTTTSSSSCSRQRATSTCSAACAQIGDMVQISSVRQKEQLGLGHAVLMAKEIIGHEPFAVMLPDDVLVGERPCIGQLIDAYRETHSAGRGRDGGAQR